LEDTRELQSALEDAQTPGEAIGKIIQLTCDVKDGEINGSTIHRTWEILKRFPDAWRKNSRRVILAVVVELILVGLVIAVTSSSILAAGLATDSMAHSDSPKCGYWQYKELSKDLAVSLINLEYEAEVTAASYANSCYRFGPKMKACNEFYKPNITYEMLSPAPCPYEGDACLNGSHSAYKLDTGLFKASTIGINAAQTYYVRRMMTCSPLLTEHFYVSIEPPKYGYDQWEYFYGPSIADYTWKTPGQKSDWEIKGYTARYYLASPRISS